MNSSRPRFHSWPPEHVSLLGTMPDSAVAERITKHTGTGITTKAVEKFRRRRKILAYTNARQVADADALRDLLAGQSMTTREVAEEMGWVMNTALRRLRECSGLTRSRAGRVWAWSARRAA